MKILRNTWGSSSSWLIRWDETMYQWSTPDSVLFLSLSMERHEIGCAHYLRTTSLHGTSAQVPSYEGVSLPWRQISISRTLETLCKGSKRVYLKPGKGCKKWSKESTYIEGFFYFKINRQLEAILHDNTNLTINFLNHSFLLLELLPWKDREVIHDNDVAKSRLFSSW